MKLELEPLGFQASEDGRVRLTIRDGDGHIIDIIEGPIRFVTNFALNKLAPGTKLGVRKVRP